MFVQEGGSGGMGYALVSAALGKTCSSFFIDENRVCFLSTTKSLKCRPFFMRYLLFSSIKLQR